MCTYLTEKIEVTGSGKGALGLVRAERRQRVPSTIRSTPGLSTR